MKILAIIAVAAVTLFFACNSSTKVPEGVTSKVLPGAEFKAQLQAAGADAQLIDVRTPGEVANGIVPSAKNIDFRNSDFKEKMATLDTEKPVFVYCAAGGRSGKAAKMLQGMGFKEIYDLKGGYPQYPK